MSFSACCLQSLASWCNHPQVLLGWHLWTRSQVLMQMEETRTVFQLTPANQRCLNTSFFQTYACCGFKEYFAKMARANCFPKRKAKAGTHGNLSSSIWIPQIKGCLGKTEFTTDLVTAGERQCSPHCPLQKKKVSLLSIKSALRQKQEVINANGQDSNWFLNS